MRPIQPADETNLGKAILAAVEESPGIYTGDLAKYLGQSRDRIRQKCYRLQRQKKLIGMPKVKPQQWFPKDWQPRNPIPEPPTEFRMPPAPLLF